MFCVLGKWCFTVCTVSNGIGCCWFTVYAWSWSVRHCWFTVQNFSWSCVVYRWFTTCQWLEGQWLIAHYEKGSATVIYKLWRLALTTPTFVHLSLSLCLLFLSLSSWLTGVLRMMCPRKNTAQCQSLSLLFASFLAAMKDASSHLSFGLKTFSQYILCPVSNYDIYVALFQSPPLAIHCCQLDWDNCFSG